MTIYGCSGGPRPDSVLKYEYQEVKASAPPEPYPDDYTLGVGDVLSTTYLTTVNPDTSGYRLQIGDIMFMEFHRNEQLNRNIIVLPDGTVTLPFLHSVHAAGSTITELTEYVQKEYKRRDLYRQPDITIALVTFNNRLKEMMEAASSTTAGQSRLTNVDQDGYVRLMLLEPILAKGKTLQQLSQEVSEAYSKLIPSMSVYFELREIRSNLVCFLGEVNSPGVVNLTTPMYLSQAIGLVGGFKGTSGLSTVVLVRPGEDNKPVARLINLSKILSSGDLSSDVILRRRDIVYVPRSVIATLNDIILMGIRNMIPIETFGNIGMGFNYDWGPHSSVRY